MGSAEEPGDSAFFPEETTATAGCFPRAPKGPPCNWPDDSCPYWYRLGSFSKEKQRCTRSSILFEEIPISFLKARKDFHRIQRSSSKRFRICSGQNNTITRRHSETNEIAEIAVRRIIQEGTATAMVQCGLPDQNGATLRWNVVATCATCTTRWPMARPRMRTCVL